ncbi:MAG: type II secretion system F family protein [Planctomycetaceae bacterium]
MPSTATPPIDRRPEFARILREEQHYATGRGDDVAERMNGWFDDLMLQSGIDIAPPMLLSLCLVAALATGGAAFVLQENLLSAAIAAGVGCVLPVLGVVLARARRQKKILDQMPGVVDELARAARTGRSIEQCLHIVADDTPNPLGAELSLCSRKLRMGAGFETALKELPRRTGLVSVHVLVMALCVHQQSGGDLVYVLERLSRTIRDRIHFLGRLKVATTASRATAILMLALPPAILTFFVFRDPDYLTRLLDARWGVRTLAIAIVLQIIGSLWVMRIMRTSRRT